MFDTFGNKVRIKRTPETEEKGLANKEGEIYGHTTPSMMDFEIIRTLKEDFAINVHFDDLDQSFWFTEDLIEQLDNGQGTEITLDGIDKKWTKDKNDEWVEEDTSPTKEKEPEQNPTDNKTEWWKFWRK